MSNFPSDQSPMACFEAVYSDPFNFRFVEKQTPFLSTLAVMKNPNTIQYVEDKRTDLFKVLATIAVSHDGSLISHVPIESQTTELCMIAIRNNPLALKSIHNKTSELVLEAVKRNANAIETDGAFSFITPEIEEVIRRDPQRNFRWAYSEYFSKKQ